jgi:ribonuclease VapC
VATAVLDSSAVIALLRAEPGAERVAGFMADAVISAVNLQEIAKHLIEAGFSADAARETLDALGLDVHPHETEDAYLAASLVEVTRRRGSGLGDRSCMALAIRLRAPALTTDRAWAELALPGLEVVLLR